MSKEAMDALARYEAWRSRPLEDGDLIRELEEIAGDSAAITDRFYRELEFGTGGLRGVIGAGTNRMNIYTVRKATRGLAAYLLEQEEAPSVAIAYDSRIKSERFARESAAVLAASGVSAWLYPELMPTPSLSFAVRELHCSAGICITASHNPAKYNGYKVYGADGCQITLAAAEAILAKISAADPFRGPVCGFEEGLAAGRIRWIPDSVRESFLDCVQAQSVYPLKAPLSVVYTPLNGAGRRCVTEILRRIGVEQVTVVPEQEMPDGNFTTCPYPNPEIREALQVGLELCERVRPDLLLATDPDCDRVGVAVGTPGGFRLLTGNEVGVMLLDYIARSRLAAGTMPRRPVAVKTIVTTDMAEGVAAEYGIELRNVLTGFKFIGEQIGLLEKEGGAGRYIFGFEESYGYLSGAYVRDKDAVNASMLICEMAADCKARGITLADYLDALYQKHGYYHNRLLSFTLEGMDGMRKMKALMERLRAEPPKELGGRAVTGYADYLASLRRDGEETAVLTLPKSNVLEFRTENGGKLVVRPSGTEPKIKAYIFAKGPTMELAVQQAELLCADASALLS